METWEQCMRLWMKENRISMALLAEKTGFRSKTTVLRLLRGESSQKNRIRFMEKMQEQGLVNQTWSERLTQAMEAEKYGQTALRQFAALQQALLGNQTEAPDGEKTEHFPFHTADRVEIFGCPMQSTFRVLAKLEKMKTVPDIEHYVTRDEILRCPDLLSSLILRLACRHYQAFMIPSEELQDPPAAWNIIMVHAGKKKYLGIPDGGGFEWYASETVPMVSENHAVRQAVPLYRCDSLSLGSSYIQFTNDAYQLEKGRELIMLKPTPGMQMLPANIVIHAFSDYLDSTPGPVSPSRQTLTYIFQKRNDNFFLGKQPVCLMFSRSAMEEFARSGKLADQFFAFRPFTQEERLQTLDCLMQLTFEERVTMAFLTDRNIFPYSFEAYTGKGVLLYPSYTNYNTDFEPYRELFLPGEAFAELFSGYAHQEVLQPSAQTREKCREYLLHLKRLVPMRS